MNSSKNYWEKISHILCNYLSIHNFCDACHSYIGKENGDDERGQTVLTCPRCDRVADMKINWRDIRDRDTLSFDWYRKETWSGRLLNFNSYHPLSHKIGVIVGLVDRIFKLSDKKFLNENLMFAKQVLLLNVIDFHIKKRLLMYQEGFPSS